MLENISLVQQKKGKNNEVGKISDHHISIEDYLTCEKIWNKFKMTNMGNYNDHYLKKDVLLLVDVFKKFIKTCLKYYEVDPCHYFSSPGLSWNAMLKMTDVKLDGTAIFTPFFIPSFSVLPIRFDLYLNEGA